MQNKQLEASEQRKMKAKQIEMQRREQARSGRGNIPRQPTYPTYTPATQTISEPMDSYSAEKNRSFKLVTLLMCERAFANHSSQTISSSRQRHATWEEIKNSVHVQPGRRRRAT